MVLSLILIIVGLVTLQEGISNLDTNPQMALLYLSVTVFTFGFVTFSILRVRRGYGIPYIAPSKVMSIVRCAQCSFKQIKNFSLGDYVFKTEGICSQCGKPSLFINSIYAEDLKKR